MNGPRRFKSRVLVGYSHNHSSFPALVGHRPVSEIEVILWQLTLKTGERKGNVTTDHDTHVTHW